MSRKRLLFLVAALAAASSLAGCTSSSPSTSNSSTTTVKPPPQHDATVVVAVPSLPTNFNPSSPAGANEITTEVMEQVWPQAFVTEPQLGTTTEPGFVEDAELQSLSPFTVVYTLNPKAVWSDGTPIGVDDFIYNWHEQVLWASRLPDSGLAAGYDDITSITSGNSGSIVFVTFSQPFTEWESLFSDLVPAHIGEKYGWATAFQGFDAGRVISGGPFEITSFTPGRELVLSRNPHYWSSPAVLGHIVLKVVPESDELADLRLGLVDIAELPDAAGVAQARATAAAAGVRLRATSEQGPTLWQLCFNMDDSTVGDPQVRTAIEHSLDLDEITADSAGLDGVASEPYGSRLELGLGLPTGAEPSAESVSGAGTSANGSTALSSGNGQYDPAAATAALTAAGYVLGPSGLWASTLTGAPLTVSLLVPTGWPVVAEAAAVIDGELEAAGFVVHLRTMSLAQMLGQTLPLGEYQLAVAPFLLTLFAGAQLPIYSGSVLPATDGAQVASGQAERAKAEPLAPYGQEHGAVEGGVVTADVFGLDDPTVTSDLEQAMSNLNPSADQSLVIAADTRLWLDLPTIPLFQQPAELVYDADIRGLSDSPTWVGIFWDAESWAVRQPPASSGS